MNAIGFLPVYAIRAVSAIELAAPGGGEPKRLDPIQLVLNASIPVKAVIVVLAVFSMLCWVVIVAKALPLARARSD